MKICPACKIDKQLSEFWPRRGRGNAPASRCKLCSKDAQAAWRRTKPGYDKLRYQAVKAETRERHLIRKYGVDEAAYAEMLDAQGGRCAICEVAAETQRYGVLHVDHCHKTGAVRGLLCRGCNHMLGVVRDDPEVLRRAISYLAGELIGRAILASLETQEIAA